MYCIENILQEGFSGQVFKADGVAQYLIYGIGELLFLDYVTGDGKDKRTVVAEGQVLGRGEKRRDQDDDKHYQQDIQKSMAKYRQELAQNTKNTGYGAKETFHGIVQPKMEFFGTGGFLES